MDYTTNADGHLTAASLTILETTMTVVLGDDGVYLALRDRDAVVRVTLRADAVEELANVLAEFVSALDDRAGRS